MTRKNLLLGLGGAILTGIGFLVFLYGLTGLILLPVFGAILSALIPGFVIVTTNFWYYVLGGIIIFFIGLKIFFDNEEALGRVIIGLCGAIILLFGLTGTFESLVTVFAGLAAISTLAGIIPGFIALLGAVLILLISLVVLGFGLALIEVGWGIKTSKVIKPVGTYVGTLKQIKG